MSVDLLPARLLMTVVSGCGALFVAAGLARLLRIRHPTLRSLVCALGVAEIVLTAFGLSSLRVLFVHVSVPPSVVARLLAPTAAPLLAVWCGVAGGLVARRLVRARRVARVTRALAALCPAPRDVAAAGRRAARIAGVASVPIALVDDDVAPCVVGLRRPHIVLPAALWRQLPTAAREALLLHEYAHVRRRDPWRLLALGLLCDVLFFNWPLRRLAAGWAGAWESQADRRALRVGATTLGLAQSVAAEVGTRLRGPRLGAAFGGSAHAADRLRDARRPPSRVLLALQVVALIVLLPVRLPSSGTTAAGLVRRTDAPRGTLAFGVVWQANPLTAPLLPALLRRWI